jgi:nucleotide-binding universal stress UspA family protein
MELRSLIEKMALMEENIVKPLSLVARQAFTGTVYQDAEHVGEDEAMANKILVALDNSAGAWGAVEYVAQTYGKTPEVQVTLLHILPGLPPEFWDHGHIIASPAEKKSLRRLVHNWDADQEKEWQGLMHKARARLEQAGIPRDAITGKFKPKDYDVAEDILDEAEAGGFDTIVMGRRGLGRAKALLLGSVTNKVAQKARDCVVTIVSNLKRIQKILFPIDLDADYQTIIPLAKDLAARHHASLLLLYVAPPVTMFPSFYVNIQMATFEAELQVTARERMVTLVREFFPDFPRLTTRVELGYPADQILKIAEQEEIDLIIMGTHGRRGLERAVFGSVAFKVVQAANCTIVTVHP